MSYFDYKNLQDDFQYCKMSVSCYLYAFRISFLTQSAPKISHANSVFFIQANFEKRSGAQ